MYEVQRKLIHLPKIGESADKVFKRIIGSDESKADADCKIVWYQGHQEFKDYDLFVTGFPVAIACGIPKYWDLDGAGKKYEPVSDGEDSTNGMNGAGYIKPPEAKAFKTLGRDYLCFQADGKDPEICLPPVQCMHLV